MEIQQSSNDTFRVYDFDRVDANGNKRELHVEQAREALDFSACPDYRTNYEAKENEAVMLVDCPQFTTRLFQLTESVEATTPAPDSFVILIAYEGEATLEDGEGNCYTLHQGESILFPACNPWKRITPQGSQRFSCLETYIESK